MSDDSRTDGGRFRPEHDDSAYVRAVAEHEPAGTTEVAEAVGVTQQNADKRLRSLEEDGRLTSKKIGTRWPGASQRTFPRSRGSMPTTSSGTPKRTSARR